MTTAQLRFSTEIVRRLGEELNPTLDKGILELVKNAYDADATDCRVELRNSDRPGGSITVEDNGDGMTADEIANGWLVLGRSSKAASQRTPLGRIPAGSKGLGRLAALRMGRTASLLTVSRQQLHSLHELVIDWSAFDEVSLVDDYALEIKTNACEEGTSSGTKVVIDQLVGGFGRVAVKRLAREHKRQALPRPRARQAISPAASSASRCRRTDRSFISVSAAIVLIMGNASAPISSLWRSASASSTSFAIGEPTR